MFNSYIFMIFAGRSPNSQADGRRQRQRLHGAGDAPRWAGMEGWRDETQIGRSNIVRICKNPWIRWGYNIFMIYAVYY